MSEFSDLCPGCMEPKEEGTETCPHCGYNEHAPFLPSYLPPRYMLCERYLIGRLLSYNGEGASYIAYDTYTETKVAVREYMPDTLCSRERGNAEVIPDKNKIAQYKTYMSEFIELNKLLTKMRTLNHINSCKEVFCANNTAYAILTYTEGKTLLEYLQDHAGELSWDEVRAIFPPIFTTLSLVHNAGLVHRGISPETIIVSDKGELKLTGFCIPDSRTANTDLAPEIFSGYAAPEQYSSNNWQGTWTDVYGISAVLYRMLTGVVPPEAISRTNNDNLVEPCGLDPNVPKNVSKVIMNGMNLSGEMRIQTITELVTMLFEQPDYMSPSKTAATSTITFNRDMLKNAHSSERVPYEHQTSAKSRSRHAIFIAVGVATLAVMFAVMIIMLFALGRTDVRSDTSPAASGTVTVISSESTMPVLTEPETIETNAVTTAQQKPSAIYIMSDFKGKYYDTIKNSETYKDNLIFVPEYKYDENVEKGIIISQSIDKGANYEKNTELKLVVSLGSKYVSVPEYIGISKKDYFSMLTSAGIKFVEEEEVTSDVLEGYVVRTSIEPGEQLDIEKGEELVVYVAVNPPDMTGISVPETSETVTTVPVIDVPPETTATTLATDDPLNLIVSRSAY